MEDFYELMEYLPFSFKNENDGKYISYLSDSFEQNYNGGKYQFALLACHMLYMGFVYFSIWQIKNSRPEDFSKSLIGFSKDNEKKLIDAKNPFAFACINEARILRFLKLLSDCDNEAIGKFSKPVQERNKIAHTNGHIFYNDIESANHQLAEILRQIENIQKSMDPVIHNCFQHFLIESWNGEEREHQNAEDQIREVLVHSNYFSQADIRSCLKFDIQSLSINENFKGINKLFETFISIYSEE